MAPFFDYVEPTFAKFADTHGYELQLNRGLEDHEDYRHPDNRAARVGKIALLQGALATHDLALWIDADAVITKFDRDIVDDLQPDCFQGFVVGQALSHFRRGISLNSGVWVMRRSAESREFLGHLMQIITSSDDQKDDQEAVCEALGWETMKVDSVLHTEPVHYSAYFEHTSWLPSEWNAIGIEQNDQARILHFAGMKNPLRLPLMHAEFVKLQNSGQI